jgi:ribonuclease Y
VQQQETLERIAGLTAEDAKKMLVQAMEDEARYEATKIARKIEEEARERADKKAKEILALAVQRYAGEYVAEDAVSVVTLPNEEMKGRIIGREGRNIRALEAATGVISSSTIRPRPSSSPVSTPFAGRSPASPLSG